MQPIINTGLSLALFIAIPVLAISAPARAQANSLAPADMSEPATRTESETPDNQPPSAARLVGAARPLDFIQRITLGKQAEEQWRQVIERDPKNAEAYRNLAKALTEQNRYRDAEAIYQRAIELDPADEDSYLALGQFLHTQTRLYETAELYQQMIEILPDSAIAHEQFASTLMRLPDEDWPADRGIAIEAAYRQSISLDPNRPTPYYGLGAYLARQGRFAEAMTAMRQIIRIDPNNNRIYATLAAIPTGNQDLAAAIAIYQEGLAAQPDNPSLYINFAQWLVNNNRNADAEAVYQQALEQMPEEALLNMAFAGYLTMVGRTEEAASQYRAAIEQNIEQADEDALPYLQLGDLLAEKGRSTEAKAAYEKAVLLSPDVDTYSRLGALLEATEGTEATIALYQRAIEKPRVEDKGYFYNRIGELLADSGQTEAAIAAYRKALDVTDSATSAKPLAALLLAQRQYDEAISLYKRFKFAFSKDPEAVESWQQALRRLGRSAEAESLEQTIQTQLAKEAELLYQKAIAISPESGQFHSLLGDALLQQDKAVAAEDAYQEAIRLNYDVFRTQIKLGKALFEQGNAEQAESAYQIAIDLSPQKNRQYFTRDQSQLYQHMGELYETTNRPQLALEFYQSVLDITPYETSVEDKIADLLTQVSGGESPTTRASTEAETESMMP